MSHTAEYKKFYKQLKKKVASSLSKNTKSSSSKGPLLKEKKTTNKQLLASTSHDPLQNDLFSGPVTQINVILEDSFSESEDEAVQLVKCKYCLKKFASLRKLYEHKLCHLSLSIDKLILPTPKNIRLERTVLNQTVPTGQHVPVLQHVPTLQPFMNYGNNIVAQLPITQPALQSIPQIPNVQLFVQPSMQLVPQLQQVVQPSVLQLQQVMQYNVPPLQPIQPKVPHLQQVPQNKDTLLQTVKPNVPLLQPPLLPLQTAQQLQNAQRLPTVPPRKKKLIEVNGFTFEEWDDNTSDATNILNEEIMFPTDIKKEIKTEPQELNAVDNTNLQLPTVATSRNEPVDPLAIDQPTVSISNKNHPDPLSIKQITLPVVGNSNQADPLAINLPNFPLQLKQLIAIPMQNGHILLASQVPPSLNNQNSIFQPQKLLVPIGNMLNGSQLPNVATQQQSTQLPIVVNQNSMLSLNNVIQQQSTTTLATQQQSTQLPIVVNQNSALSLNNVIQQPITTLATQQQTTQLPYYNVATKEQNTMLPNNTHESMPLPINNVANVKTELKYTQDIKSKKNIEKSDDFDELNHLVEKEQKEKDKKQQERIKKKLLKEPYRKREKKQLSDILRETAFAFQEDMIGTKQRRRRRPGVEPRKLRKSEMEKKMLAEKTVTPNTSTEKNMTTKDSPTNTCTEKTATKKDVLTNTCTEKTATKKDVPTNTCTEKTYKEKIIASVDLTEMDEPEDNVSDYTPPYKLVRPEPSFIPGSEKIPGSWDKKPKKPAIISTGSWNKTNSNSLFGTGKRKIVTAPEIPLKTSYLKALLQKESRPLDNYNPNKIYGVKSGKKTESTTMAEDTATETEQFDNMFETTVPTTTITKNYNIEENVPSNTLTSKTVTLKDVAERNIYTNKVRALNITIMSDRVTLPWERLAQKVSVEKTWTPTTETEKNNTTVAEKASTWKNMTLKDMIENKVPLNTVRAKNVPPETSSQKTVVGKTLDTYNTKFCEKNDIPLTYDELIQFNPNLHCIYCNQFSANWYNLISHMRHHLKVTLSRIEKCIICTKRYCTKEGGKFCFECAPFYKEVQDKHDLKFSEQRNNLKFVKLHKVFEEPECILEGLNSDCELQDPLACKNELLEDICTKDPELNESCTNMDGFEDPIYTEKDISGTDSTSMRTNIDIFEENYINYNKAEKPIRTESESDENDTCTNKDAGNVFAQCPCTNIETEEKDTCTDIEPLDEDIGTKMECDDVCADLASCTSKKDTCKKKDPFQEKDAKLLQYCEICYHFGLRFGLKTCCGIKNHVYKYKCVDEVKKSKKLLECNKCGGRFTSMKYVVRYITKKKMCTKVKKPAYNVHRLMLLEKKISDLNVK